MTDQGSTLIGHRSRLNKTLKDGREHPRRTQAWVLHAYIHTSELDLIPSFPTLNHHLTEGTQRPTTDRPPNPKSTRTAATGTPETRLKQETPRTPDSPLIRSDPIRPAPIRSDPERKNWFLG
ncbi:hypothetical protein PGTUg99_010829 [Puccinia graminis f. sp. tritici]|uniref:Uncharacterized protein n=1 Tax=Puccinia graminis f. sp. tritici TaxID=56615 RepID=A0A5B0SG91_PUCGR|nr:hypothetical protein PGTUg99_010829 [Puccinia graminis f. sp. tritici]